MTTCRIISALSFLILLLLPTTATAKWCREEFQWNRSLVGVKLLEDCDILNDEFSLSDSLGSVANRFECIKYVYLTIFGTQMDTWETGGKPFATRKHALQNPLDMQQRRQKGLISLTARNPQLQRDDFSSQFRIDSRNCPEIEKEDKSATESIRKDFTTTFATTSTSSNPTMSTVPSTTSTTGSFTSSPTNRSTDSSDINQEEERLDQEEKKNNSREKRTCSYDIPIIIGISVPVTLLIMTGVVWKTFEANKGKYSRY